MRRLLILLFAVFVVAVIVVFSISRNRGIQFVDYLTVIELKPNVSHNLNDNTEITASEIDLSQKRCLLKLDSKTNGLAEFWIDEGEYFQNELFGTHGLRLKEIKSDLVILELRTAAIESH